MEEKHCSEFDDVREPATVEDIEMISEAIDQINQAQFKILALIKFQSSNSFV